MMVWDKEQNLKKLNAQPLEEQKKWIAKGRKEPGIKVLTDRYLASGQYFKFWYMRRNKSFLPRREWAASEIKKVRKIRDALEKAGKWEEIKREAAKRGKRLW